ncbi:MAG TPA: hypothetical protein VGO61_17305 [Steroidobacteraceae bacterium]|jgi:hypothetical protein|nr:hypothetical protein [Steroidobacteraceae bacterium]
MKSSQSALRGSAVLFALGASITGSPFASAVNLSAYPSTIEQYGTGSAFYLGHTVMAHTAFTSLSAGGTYSAQCAHPATLPVTGERTLSTYGIGGNSLIVTIPAQQPAIANMTGWNQVGGGTELACNYRWTAFAIESGFSIGAGGISFPIGDGTERTGGTVDFSMIRGNTNLGGGGCTP